MDDYGIPHLIRPPVDNKTTIKLEHLRTGIFMKVSRRSPVVLPCSFQRIYEQHRTKDQESV